MVVVFVHGILSSGETAWRGEQPHSWPELLLAESELASVSIYVYTYLSDFFSGNYSVGDVVDDLKERFRLDGLHSYERVLFVCHSMGGIVARKLIVSREADFSQRGQSIALFLVASPSLGSQYANWLKLLAGLFGHAQARVLEFSQHNLWLNDLDKEFLNLKESRRLNIIGKELVEHYFSSKRRFCLLKAIVEPISGARYFGDQIKINGSDHFTISKPEGRNALQHKLLCEFASRFLGIRPTDTIGSGTRPALIETPMLASTNDESQRLIAGGHKLPFILHAWNQTHGKGKLGRTWQGGAGVLTATWNYNFGLDRSGPEVLGLLHVVSALAVRDAILELNPALTDVRLKWPNDVLIGGKKVAGALIEVRRDIAGKVASIGVGMNVCRIPEITDRRQFALPPASIFTDFDDDNAREQHIEAAIKAITPNLERRIRLLVEGLGLGAQRTEYEELDYSRDRLVMIVSPTGATTAKGYNRGITAQGQLILEFSTGKRREYHSGEVASLRSDEVPDVDAPPSRPQAPVHMVAGKKYYKILSPMLGTFYDSPTPGRSALVKIGDRISEGQVVCIIEAMKMMNEIEADVDGVVVECLCTTGQPIDYLQPLFVVLMADR